MKKKFIIFLIATWPLLSPAQSKVKIGMSMDEVKKVYTNTTSASYQNTITLSRPDTLYGLADQWGYRFENNKLSWIFFHKYIDELNQANFDLCLSAFHKLVKDFNVKYGKADSLITGDTTFIDPFVKHHWGYDVMEAQWKDADGMKIDIEFTFMGGKGEYHFLVTINIFDKSYPYFH